MVWWKIYFWIYAVLSAIGLLVLLPQLSTFNFATYEGLLESILLVIGTYTFIYKKHIIPNIWKIIFFLMLIVWAIQLIYYSNAIPSITPYLRFFETSISQGYGTVVFTMIISIPAIFAVYKLGFSKTVK